MSEKEIPYDNKTEKECPICHQIYTQYPALSRRDNKTYICPDCGVQEALEDYMNAEKKNIQEATMIALSECEDNKSYVAHLNESVSWDYYDKFEDLISKYMPDQGEGETFASQIVTAVNKLVYKWYNDGDVFDNVNSGLEGWANDLSSYANWLYKYAPGDAPKILKNIYGMGEKADYETLLKELADTLLNENLLDSLEKQKQGTIYDCDGPFEFKEYSEDDDEDYYEEEDFEDDEELDESKKEEAKEIMKKELNKDELLGKLEDYVLNQYTEFNDKLYDDFGDIQINDKNNNKRSIYVYYNIDEDKISVTVGAAGARTLVDNLDEVAQFINAEIAKVNAQDEEIKNVTTESKGEEWDKEHDEYLKKMNKKYKTFCKNMEIKEDPDDAIFALDELEGQFGDEEGEYQELREFIYNELIESKEIKTEDIEDPFEQLKKAIETYENAYMEYLRIEPKYRDDWDKYFEKHFNQSITSTLQEPENLLKKVNKEFNPLLRESKED